MIEVSNPLDLMPSNHSYNLLMLLAIETDKDKSYLKGLDLVDLMYCPRPVMHRLRLLIWLRIYVTLNC